MTDEIQKHREEKKRSEKVFAAIEKSREHFIEASKEVTKAEEHLEKEAKLQISIDEGLQQTEKDLIEAEKEIIGTHQKIRREEGSEEEKRYQREKKRSPLNKPSQ